MNDAQIEEILKQNGIVANGDVFVLSKKELEKLMRDSFHYGILAEYNAAKVRGDSL